MLIICLIMYIIDFYLQNVKMIPFDELCFLGRVVGGSGFTNLSHRTSYVPSSCDSDSRYFYQKHTSNYFQKVFSNGRHIFLPKQVNGPNKAV